MASDKKQTKSPAFQFYYKEWLTGTKGMTRTEKDIYLTLLIFQFDSKNKLPNDFDELKRLCEIKNKKEIQSLNYVLKKKFSVLISNNVEYLVNNKMAEVLKDLDLYKDRQSLNGSKGGRGNKAVGLSGFSETKPKKRSTTTTTTTTTTDSVTKKNTGVFPEQVPVVKILKGKKEKPPPPLHSEFNDCKNHWLNEVHKGFIFSAAKGAALNQLLTKIKESYKLAGVDYNAEIIIEAFKRFCKGLNGTWCEDKDIDVVNGKYNEIIIEIKKNKNSPKPKANDPTILPYSLLKSKQDKTQCQS